MRRALTTCLLRATLACLLIAPGVAHALPTLAGFNTTVQAGDTFVIPISAFLIPSDPGLTSVQFDLGFDPAILRADLVEEGTFLSSAGQTLFVPGVIDNTSGLISLVTLFYVDIGTPPSGDGVVADVTFTALAPGVSPLVLTNAFLNGGTLDLGLIRTAVTVLDGGGGGTAVPEPGTGVLVACGVVAAVARRRIG